MAKKRVTVKVFDDVLAEGFDENVSYQDPKYKWRTERALAKLDEINKTATHKGGGLICLSQRDLERLDITIGIRDSIVSVFLRSGLDFDKKNIFLNRGSDLCIKTNAISVGKGKNKYDRYLQNISTDERLNYPNEKTSSRDYTIQKMIEEMADDGIPISGQKQRKIAFNFLQRKGRKDELIKYW